MKFDLKPDVKEKLSEVIDRPSEYFSSPDFWDFVYKTCQTYNDWNFLSSLQFITKKLAEKIPSETIDGFNLNWRLPNNPDPRLPSRSLAKTNSRIFERIKKALRTNGEGQYCWACGISTDECKNLLANTAHIGLAAHEIWSWDEHSYIRKLIDVKFLCFECHYLTGQEAIWTLHGRTREKDMSRIQKFCRINNCNVPEMWAQMTHAMHKKRRLSKTDPAKWVLDFSPFVKLMPDLENYLIR
jgi:hypothetical protein